MGRWKVQPSYLRLIAGNLYGARGKNCLSIRGASTCQAQFGRHFYVLLIRQRLCSERAFATARMPVVGGFAPHPTSNFDLQSGGAFIAYFAHAGNAWALLTLFTADEIAARFLISPSKFCLSGYPDRVGRRFRGQSDDPKTRPPDIARLAYGVLAAARRVG